MENINEIIGNNIKELRKFNKMTQYDLSERLHYSNKTISRWEAGEIIPDVKTLNELSEIFNVPLSKLFEKDIMSKYKLSSRYKFQISNKLAISLLYSCCVWLIAVCFFVHYKITYNVTLWQAFVWAIPISCLVGLLFNKWWGIRKFNYLLLSIIAWSSLACVFVSFYNYRFWSIFLIGIPIQVAIFLWMNISKNNIENKKEKNKKK